ncbi:MAG: type VI secretion system-associated protein TagF [Neisseriaceae bacterium]|nr:type VI secretion system-associated protein TagF [Neisseriaceae bacterium]
MTVTAKTTLHWLGKLPTQRDFVMSADGCLGQQRLLDWCQQGIAAQGQALLAHRPQADVPQDWFFWLRTPQIPDALLYGMASSSHDQVGRRHPFLLYREASVTMLTAKGLPSLRVRALLTDLVAGTKGLAALNDVGADSMMMAQLDVPMVSDLLTPQINAEVSLWVAADERVGTVLAYPMPLDAILYRKLFVQD